MSNYKQTIFYLFLSLTLLSCVDNEKDESPTSSPARIESSTHFTEVQFTDLSELNDPTQKNRLSINSFTKNPDDAISFTYHFAVGTSPGKSNIRPWTPAPYNYIEFKNLSVNGNQRYFATIKISKNNRSVFLYDIFNSDTATTRKIENNSSIRGYCSLTKSCYSDERAKEIGTAITVFGQEVVYSMNQNGVKLWKDIHSNRVLVPTGTNFWHSDRETGFILFDFQKIKGHDCASPEQSPEKCKYVY